MSWKRPTITPEQREQERRERIARQVPPSGRLHRGVMGGTSKPLPAPHRPSRESDRATAAEREHMGRVKRLRCVLCAALGQAQDGPTDVHHIREGQGGAQRASHWLTVALCHDGCHQGPHGIHGDRARLRQAKCTELDLLALTLETLEKGLL
jgi:alkylhydroperoxidase family enzyme